MNMLSHQLTKLTGHLLPVLRSHLVDTVIELLRDTDGVHLLQLPGIRDHLADGRFKTWLCHEKPLPQNKVRFMEGNVIRDKNMPLFTATHDALVRLLAVARWAEIIQCDHSMSLFDYQELHFHTARLAPANIPDVLAGDSRVTNKVNRLDFHQN
jgi:hypothetical protein